MGGHQPEIYYSAKFSEKLHKNLKTWAGGWRRLKFIILYLPIKTIKFCLKLGNKLLVNKFYLNYDFIVIISKMTHLTKL